MDIRSGDKDVQTRMFRLFHRTNRSHHVRLFGPRETQNNRRGEEFGDSPDRLEVPVRRGGEPGLNDIHVELLQLAGDHNLFFDIHGRARRLLTVAQCGVENLNDLPFHTSSFFGATNKKGCKSTRSPLQTRRPRAEPARGLRESFASLFYALLTDPLGGILNSRPSNSVSVNSEGQSV